MKILLLLFLIACKSFPTGEAKSKHYIVETVETETKDKAEAKQQNFDVDIFGDQVEHGDNYSDGPDHKINIDRNETNEDDILSPREIDEILVKNITKGVTIDNQNTL